MHFRKTIITPAIKVSAAKPERRGNPRFALCCPADVKFGSNDIVHEIQAWTKNVSTGGILLESPERITPNSHVEFVINIRRSFTTLRLKSTGRVVREERLSSGKGFWIAIQCERPIRLLSTVRKRVV
jgi:PilZ domain-containing protein